MINKYCLCKAAEPRYMQNLFLPKFCMHCGLFATERGHLEWSLMWVDGQGEKKCKVMATYYGIGIGRKVWGLTKNSSSCTLTLI